jgi:hypothetical protein
MKTLTTHEIESVSGGLSGLGSIVDLGGLTISPAFNATDSLGVGTAVTGVANAVGEGYKTTLSTIGSAISGIFG